jgi:hypothetical protein
MAARDYEQDARNGIKDGENSKKIGKISERCASGGTKAIITTPVYNIPVMREWEYANGPILVFSKLDSCLGAIQIAGESSLIGAHFSQCASKEFVDRVHFYEAMRNAGFDDEKPIYYFGGSILEWKKGFGQGAHGLGHCCWMPGQDIVTLPKLPQFEDKNGKAWIFQSTGNDISSITFYPFTVG